MCWTALDRAAKLAEQGALPDRAASWRRAADDVRAWIETDGWDEARGTYRRAPDHADDMDSALVTLALCAYSDASDPRFAATIDVVRRELGAGPLLYRTPRSRDTEGAFLACSFWLADALGRAGRVDEGGELMDELVALANDVGLYAEQMDAETGEFLGNFPQGLVHLALVNTAVSLAGGAPRSDHVACAAIALSRVSAVLTIRNIAEVATAIAGGDLSKKITVDVSGEILQLKQTLNTMVDQLNAFAGEVTRVAREVGTEGKLGGQAQVPGVAGTWKDLTDNVNLLAANLTTQVRNIAEVTTAVARGDLSRKITVDVKGEILELKNTINTMVDQLNAFAAEVTRVAREVGTDGQAGRPGAGARRGRHVEGPDRLGQRHGRQPHRAAARRRRRWPRPSPTATCPRRSPWTSAARSCRSRTPSTRWWTS